MNSPFVSMNRPFVSMNTPRAMLCDYEQKYEHESENVALALKSSSMLDVQDGQARDANFAKQKNEL